MNLSWQSRNKKGSFTTKFTKNTKEGVVIPFSVCFLTIGWTPRSVAAYVQLGANKRARSARSTKDSSTVLNRNWHKVDVSLHFVILVNFVVKIFAERQEFDH